MFDDHLEQLAMGALALHASDAGHGVFHPKRVTAVVSRSMCTLCRSALLMVRLAFRDSKAVKPLLQPLLCTKSVSRTGMVDYAGYSSVPMDSKRSSRSYTGNTSPGFVDVFENTQHRTFLKWWVRVKPAVQQSSAIYDRPYWTGQ